MSGLLGQRVGAKEMAGIIAAADNIVISAHTGPDGDAVGSVSALLAALKGMSKNVIAVLETLPLRFREIEGAGLIEYTIPEGFRMDAFIALDCGDKGRLGRFEGSFDSAGIQINIDHHASNDFFGTHNCVEENACATAEIIYDILTSGNGFVIDKAIASALYAGILYDTGGFKHSQAKSRPFFIAGELINYGADFNDIYKKIFGNKRLQEIHILAVAFEKMRREIGGALVWTSITAEEMSRVDATPGDLDNVVDYCKSVEGAKIAAFIYQRAESEFKISLRSEPGYDISKIAARFGGGGHKNAAGSSYSGTLEECVAAVMKEVGKVLPTEV